MTWLPIRRPIMCMTFLAVAFSYASECWGQSKPTNSLEIIESDSPDDGPRIVRMSVTPAAAPVPKLHYRFTVPPHRTTAGNAATAYMRSLAEQGLYAPIKRATDKYGQDEFYEFVSGKSLNAISVEEIRGASQFFDGYVEMHIDRATRCRDCDWGMAEETLSGDQFLVFLLPFMQESRSISRILALQTRCAIKEGDFERAIERLRMNYLLGYRVGKAKILVCSLIGMAERAMATDSMLDLIAAPNSPNMYWALGTLPEIESDFLAALQLDLSLGPRILDIDDIESQDYADEEWNRRLRVVTARLLQGIGDGKPAAEATLTESLAATGAVMARYRDAKQRLVDSGMNQDEIESMAVGKVVLVDATREYQHIADEIEAMSYLPWQQAGERLSEIDQNQFESEGTVSLGQMMAQQIMPASAAMYRGVIRIRRRLAAIRAIEAIRMHAATAGTLPETLDDIRDVYVPNNPATDKPFLYRLERGTAIIDLPLSDVADEIAVRYEVSLAK